MPIPAAAIVAGSSLLGQGINAISQGSMNRKTRAFTKEMYNIQRRDALADWAMQNEYNSPSAQMQRLRDAKLNPNLVYGSGEVAGQGGSIRQSSVEGWNPKAPQFDLGGAAMQSLSAYIDTKVKEAQVDNLREQNTVLQMEALLKDSQIGVNKAQTGKLAQEVAVQGALAPYLVEGKKQEVKKLMAETALTMTKNDVEELMKGPNFEKALNDILIQKKQLVLMQSQLGLNQVEVQRKKAEIRNLEAQFDLLKTEGKLKDFEYWLKDERGKASDYPAWMKPAVDLLHFIKGGLDIWKDPTKSSGGFSTPSR